MILIITNKEDVHPTPVIDILNKRNIPVFRFEKVEAEPETEKAE